MTRRTGDGLAGKVCVVTGASSGIGRTTALDLARAGAALVVAARREDRLVELLSEMGPGDHSYVVTDVSDRSQVAALTRHVGERHGRCDVLVNNAGIGSNRRFDGPDAIAEVERVMATNFFGAVFCTGEMLPLLLESKPAHVVNVASVAGRIALGGISAYNASKFALVGWSESLYQELAPLGVTVSLVEPGFISTEGFPQEDLKSDRVLRHTLGTVEQVSDAIQDVIKGSKMQRTVPRWYYLAQIPRLLTPPLYRFAVRKLVAPRQERRAG